MHKVILATLLAVVSSSAMAEWVMLSSDSEGTIVYVDPKTIRKSGNKVKMWALWDYSTAEVLNSKPHMSTRVQKEFNCEEETTRQIYATTFSGNMAEGNTIGMQGGREWEPVAPRTHNEALWKFACGK